MSASREKKARQADPTINEKKRLAQEKEATSKRKIRLYAVIGVIVAAAAAALLVWDSGIFQRNAVAATINGVEYTTPEVDYYYNVTKAQFIGMATTYAQYGMDTGYDLSKTPAEQIFSTNEETGEVTTYEDYFRNNALATMRTIVALNAAAAAEGYTLSEEGKATLESQSKAIDQTAVQYGTTRDAILKSNYGTYITEEIFNKHTELTLIANEYSARYQESLQISDSELTAYYEANKDDLDSFDYRYAYISGAPETKTDADGKTIEATEEEKAAAMADAKERADAMAAAVKGGQDFDTIAKDYVSESTKQYYETKDYTLRTGSVGSSLSALYRDWLLDPARKSGDVTVVESSGSGYAVVMYLDRYLSDSVTVDVRHILIQPEGDSEDATTFTDAQWGAAAGEAQALLTQFLIGADKSAEAFGKLADEYSQDGRDEAGNLYYPGGLYTAVAEGQMVKEFNDWIFDDARVAGDVDLVKTDYGWHVIYFVSRNEIIWKSTAKSALLSEAVDQWIGEIVETYAAA